MGIKLTTNIVSVLFLLLSIYKKDKQNKMFLMRAHNRIMNNDFVVVQHYRKAQLPRHGYKRNKYRLPHHGTIVNKRCQFDPYRNILFSFNCFKSFTVHL